ncbi:hypothetical protein QWJ26_24465 [Streptomyces sp. CSDS2]|uniref:DUF7739 domain-containing protein n=1 Tax=Streptomyces sp. CSDS2 TaxID=3055051 RepID=UPI0025AECDE4|nr:hypothetical protein [Streptomyces sp. CSDS2]MDN3262903.1 hypothetical protein [Streptomyces sp. CSDS2]
MSTHVTVSHGSDFFGVDTLPVRQLRDFGQHVRSVLPENDHPPLTRLLDDAGETEHTLDSDQAALLAVLLRRAAAHRRLKKPYRELAARLGIAAATAAADTQPWTWTTTTEGAR